jgi:hypothetical protein
MAEFLNEKEGPMQQKPQAMQAQIDDERANPAKKDRELANMIEASILSHGGSLHEQNNKQAGYLPTRGTATMLAVCKSIQTPLSI